MEHMVQGLHLATSQLGRGQMIGGRKTDIPFAVLKIDPEL